MSFPLRLLVLLATCTCAGLLTAAEEAASVGSENSILVEKITAHAWLAKIGNTTYEFTFAADGSCQLAGADFAGTWRDLLDNNTIVVKWETVPNDDWITYDLKKPAWHYTRAGFGPVKMNRMKTAEEIKAEQEAAKAKRREEERREEEEEHREKLQESWKRLRESAQQNQR